VPYRKRRNQAFRKRLSGPGGTQTEQDAIRAAAALEEYVKPPGAETDPRFDPNRQVPSGTILLDKDEDIDPRFDPNRQVPSGSLYDRSPTPQERQDARIRAMKPGPAILGAGGFDTGVHPNAIGQGLSDIAKAVVDQVSKISNVARQNIKTRRANQSQRPANEASAAKEARVEAANAAKKARRQPAARGTGQKTGLTRTGVQVPFGQRPE
jgi:hypothetical protein